MKHAISISLGSSKRDKNVKVNLNGQEILVERIGTDGDIEKARRMYLDLDGKWMPLVSEEWIYICASTIGNIRFMSR